MYRCCILLILVLATAELALVAQSIPTSMAVCDGNQCDTGQWGASTWTFTGAQGTVVWPVMQAAGTVKVQQWDSNGVVIVRDDTSGRTAGLHVVYQGKLSASGIAGQATYSWVSKGIPARQDKWHAIFNTGAAFVPAKQQSLDGVWHLLSPQFPGTVFRFKAAQTGDQVKFTWVDTHSWKDGTVLFHGRFVSATTIEGEAQAGDSTPQKLHMLKGHVTLDGPNRMLGNLGGVSDRGEGPPSRPPAVQARGPALGPPSPLTMLLLGIFAIAIDHGPETPSGKFSRLRDEARSICSPNNSRGFSNPNYESCLDKRDAAQAELGDAREELAAEIRSLMESQQKLTGECKAGNQKSCQKEKEVEERLGDDRGVVIGLDPDR